MSNNVNNPSNLKVFGGYIVLCFILGGLGTAIYGYFKNKDARDAEQAIRSTRFEKTVDAMNVVSATLKDSGSAKFSDQNYNCGFVNAKNSFGAYTGYKRYVVVGGQAFIEDNNVSLQQLENAWNNLCLK